MKTYEIGVLPESEWFFFSPSEETKKMFYYHTMCGHFYCSRDYYIKRETYPPCCWSTSRAERSFLS